MATIAEIKKLRGQPTRFSQMRKELSGTRITEEHIINIIERVFNQKFREFEAMIRERAVKGDKGDVPVLGKDFVVPTEDSIAKRAVKLMPQPQAQKIDENSLISRVIKQVPQQKIKKETPEETALRLNTLKEALTIDVIKGLEERLREIGDDARKRVSHGGSGGGDTIRVRNLTSQVDGSTKTFSLDRVNDVLQVNSTQWPRLFDPDKDYIWDSEKQQLRFTGEVAAIKSGQTLTVLVVES